MAISGAVILESPLRYRRYQCADTPGFTKGDLLQLIDPNTASGGNIVAGSAFAGIAAADKVSGDGSTNISCIVEGLCDIQMGDSACAIGSLLMMSGANMVIPATAAAVSGGAIVGKALEAGSAWEKIRVAVGEII